MGGVPEQEGNITLQVPGGAIIAQMTAAYVLPTAEAVTSACQEYASDIAEAALAELFARYPHNNNEAHVLLKVVTLNRLYSTNILAVYDVARHISQLAEEIDAGVSIGSPEIVDRIAKVRLATTGRIRNGWSFATKYCSWHNQDVYPIWDSRVCRYLSSLKGTPFAHPDRWSQYREFRDLMTSFRDHYGLGSFTFKQIDKFLWKHGEEPAATKR